MKGLVGSPGRARLTSFLQKRLGRKEASFRENGILSEMEFFRIRFCHFLKKLEIVRIGICQNWKLSQLKIVRIWICQNWKLSELEFVWSCLLGPGTKFQKNCYAWIAKLHAISLPKTIYYYYLSVFRIQCNSDRCSLYLLLNVFMVFEPIKLTRIYFQNLQRLPQTFPGISSTFGVFSSFLRCIWFLSGTVFFSFLDSSDYFAMTFFFKKNFPLSVNPCLWFGQKYLEYGVPDSTECFWPKWRG